MVCVVFAASPLDVVEELEALDSYLELNGAVKPHNLLRKQK